jgi:hypothetical protein
MNYVDHTWLVLSGELPEGVQVGFQIAAYWIKDDGTACGSDRRDFVAAMVVRNQYRLARMEAESTKQMVDSTPGQTK